MYIPEYQNNKNIDELKLFISENSFGILVTHSENRSHATHIPLLLEKDEEGADVLTGHIAKANFQWKHFGQDDVLCIFNGPHAYISSSWYKEEEVPTWNYIAVHIYGSLQLLTEEQTMNSLHRLVDTFEANSKNPISLHNMSTKTLRQVKGIVGFQIKIKEIQARYKLSQNREEDHAQIVSELREQNSQNTNAIADLIVRNPSK
ncbi:FMN-binding negative transcriptional regulator [Euzebyella marina]|uniref:FMN-binding negative transcriptional regulator n=1 Tax=Euzebyella marina TaxID=1761453 RepID=A0A3G2L680_9FLAO|nr:FMN-binding negative transcriptional regulator [Euzebyella marina]AYN67748.1 FMN-binding negative transcriptional regulator [Euzebyella marina]